jgi:hypothetical protein
VSTRKRPVHRLGDLLPGIASQLGFDEELRIARAMSSWQRIVGELVPAATGASRLLEIRPPGLFVSADDAPTGQEAAGVACGRAQTPHQRFGGATLD